MNFNINLNLPESSNVLLTPRLRQAFDIIAMNCQELTKYVAQEIENNPVLDVSCDDSYIFGCAAGEDPEEEGSDPEPAAEHAAEDSSEYASLKEYLLVQLDMSDLNQVQRRIAEYLIDSIDENGYLKSALTEAASYFNVPLKKTEEVLKRLQGFDPPGIFARDIKECLLLQANQLYKSNGELAHIIEKHLDALAAGEFGAIAEDMMLPVDKVKELHQLVKTLEPKPGREFYNIKDIKYIVPDIYVEKIRGKFEVHVNEEAVPVVNINDYYRKLVEREISCDVRKFVLNRLNSAAWLIQCIDERKMALLNLAEFIVSREEDFFNKGKKFKKVLDRKEASEATGIQEFLLGKVKEGKYLQCLWGTFELDYFFR